VQPAQCQNVARGGAAIPETKIASAPPAATGGNIVAGTYFLTTWEVYTGVGGAAGPTGESRKDALVISSTLIQEAATSEGADQPILASTYMATGSTVSTEEVCPVAGRALTHSYSATGTTLAIIDSFGATNTRLYLYTKQ
jgi:hypothetical protein